MLEPLHQSQHVYFIGRLYFLRFRVRSIMRGMSNKYRLFRNAVLPVLPQDGDNDHRVSSTSIVRDMMTDYRTLTGSMSGKAANWSLFFLFS